MGVGFWTRKLRVDNLWRVLVNSAVTSSVILIVIGAANALNWVIATQQVPAMVRGYLDAVVTSKWMFLALINVVFLIAGMLLEGISAMILLVPILLPAAVSWGIDPVLFTVIVLINLNIGLVTPPVALCLYMAANIAQRRAETVFVAALPFLGVLLLVLLMRDLRARFYPVPSQIVRILTGPRLGGGTVADGSGNAPAHPRRGGLDGHRRTAP